jgi:hypothetical protein
MKFESPDSKCESAAADRRPVTRRQEITDAPGEEGQPGGEHSLRAWFRIYGWVKRCFFNPPAQTGVKNFSLFAEFSAHRITFVISFAALAAALALHVFLPPEISEPPLAIFGCSLLSLVVSGRWGTIAAIFYCVMVLAVKIHFHIEPFGMAVLLWNCGMRFLFLEIYVVLFVVVRRQASYMAER